MSHAGQLLAESPKATEEDRRLTDIIRTNAERVSGIIENIQRLSRREPAQLERLALGSWAEEFHEEFCETMQWPRARMQLSGATPEIEVRADPDQLRQIVWNSGERAKHNRNRHQPDHRDTMRAERQCLTFFEVADRKGVALIGRAIFEPFYSGAKAPAWPFLRELANPTARHLYEPPRAAIRSDSHLPPRRWRSDGATPEAVRSDGT